MGRRGAAAAGAIAVALALGPGAGTAGAIPWDQGGAIPPSRTPPAARPDPLCEQSYANDKPKGGPAIHFGVGPRLAGEIGAGQTTPLVPERPAKRDAALKRLAGHRRLTVRLNRLFESDGRRGIARFKAMAAHYGRLGLDVELQVRYHPRPAHDGDIAAWLRFVNNVVRAVGPNRHVTGLQIANEVNLTFSMNTSDGAYRHAVRALVRGVEEAQRLSNRLGYRRLRIGFNYAWRFDPKADAAFWTALRRTGGRAFRRAVDWVGVDLYPGTYVPGAGAIVHYGDAFLEGLAQVRECYMPRAGLGRRVPLRVEETGWPTGPGRPAAQQRSVLRAFVTTAVRYRGTYGIRAFDWFGLRDNNSHGPDYQSYFGLLRDDYSTKPAFGDYRRLIARYGVRPGPAPRARGAAGPDPGRAGPPRRRPRPPRRSRPS